MSKLKTSIATTNPSSGYAEVCSAIVELLQAARQTAARNVNALMTASYWEIGRRIVEAEQKGKRRAGYGAQLIERLSLDLTQQFGRGFSGRNLEQMRQFYLTWVIPQTPSAESSKRLPTTAINKSQTVSVELLSWTALAKAFLLPWSAYVRLLSVKNDNTRKFYEVEALRGGWSVRQIGSQFVELKRALEKSAAKRTEQNATTDAILPSILNRFLG